MGNFRWLFDLYPHLKLIACHGGGTLLYLVGRLTKGDEVELPSRRKMRYSPYHYLRHIYYDCITYNPGALHYLISVAGASQVMFGTDWPHQVHGIKGSFGNTGQLPAEQCELYAAVMHNGYSVSETVAAVFRSAREVT